MARISEITIKEHQEYYYLSIRKTIDFMKEYEEFTENSFRKITDYLDRRAVLVSDGPIVCFHNMDFAKLDVEAGFPVARHIDGNEEIQMRLMPAQKAVTVIDQGDYDKQDETLEEVFAWIQSHGCKPLGDIRYQYLNDINRPSDQYLTKMIMSVQ